MEQTDAKQLLNKYRSGDCTPEEIICLRNWFNNVGLDQSTEATIEELELISRQMWEKISAGRTKTGKISSWYRVAAVAAILFVTGFGGYFYFNRWQSVTNDIKPGGNKAILTLSNGSTITLTDAKNGALAEQSGVQITKTAEGQVVYASRHPELVSESPGQYTNALNTIETPRGGQYQIKLPDGSKVWLNAASKLTYPVTFNGREERRVELSGEAYFEVAKDKKHPFLVKTTKQEVRVLGTHFNVEAYADEPAVKTTLLEGAVKINESVVLKPGEQSVLTAGKLKVLQVEAQDAVAWKNGLFVFEAEPLENVMRRIERWYDVEVVYQGVNKNELYGGSISRYDNVSKVLRKLELTKGIHFKIEGRRIVVTK